LSLGGGEKPAAADYAKLLAKVQTRPDAHLIQTVMLRSLSQARYSPDNIGHFGLSHEQYLHFTSPIRRYPDLLVHRAIRYRLQTEAAKKKAGNSGRRAGFPYTESDMVSLGEHCSVTERRADDATRDAVDWLKCEYMLDKVGEDYEGIVSSVTSFGIFVELKDIYVEGLVHITALHNDYYHFDPAGHRLRGERTGKVYRLGDQIRVKVVRVNLDDRKIDFELADAEEKRKQARGEGGKAQAQQPAKKSRRRRKSRRTRRDD
jgi:ribonuclease R